MKLFHNFCLLFLGSAIIAGRAGQVRSLKFLIKTTYVLVEPARAQCYIYERCYHTELVLLDGRNRIIMRQGLETSTSILWMFVFLTQNST